MIALSCQQRPLVTVILLCYNHQNFVADAIDGVFSQTYSPLEIIILDDCSQDQTSKIVQQKIAQHSVPSNARFIRNPKNMGQHAIFEAGLSLAKGDFIVFSCGDDIMLPGMVEKLVDVWKSEGVSLVTANASLIDENSQPLHRTFRTLDQADDSFETLARDGSNACCFGAAIGFEREVYSAFGWPPAYLSAHDIALPFYGYLLKGARFIPEPLLKYRVSRQNSSLSLTAERSSAMERFKIEERIYLGHLTHAVFMEEELNRLCTLEPERYVPIVQRIVPLLNVQMAEMSKKLVRLRRAHCLD